MKKIIYLIMVYSVIAIGMISCEKNFEVINENPNTPSRSTVEAQMMLPGLIRGIATFQVNQSLTGMGGLVIQHLSSIRGQVHDTYQWINSAPGWSGFYGDLRDVYNMYDIAKEKGGQENYMAIALILKSWIFSYLTDAYGEIPYSEAVKGKEDINFPRYDTQEAVYDGMLADLVEANRLIQTNSRTALGDILYGGDMLKWQKFANSLRLRMLMRISDRRNVAQDMAEIVSHPEQFPVFQSNDDNAALKYLPDPPNQFPLYTLRITDQAYYVISSTLMDKLNKWDDPRRTVYAKPTQNSQTAYANGTGPLEYRGIENGAPPSVLASVNPFDLSNIGNNYYGAPNAAEGKLMTYPELLFLLAEAAQKGWIQGDAKTYYTNGINASFEYYNVTPPAGYFDQPGVKWVSGKELELIGTQKWIDLYFNGYEAWFEWRRTDIPHLDPATVNYNDDMIPVRFEYPAEEQNINGANYNEAVDRQGPNTINTHVWWDVN